MALALIGLLLPGLAWWAWFGKREQEPLVSLAQILGISLAAITLLAEMGFLLGFVFSGVTVVIALAFFAVLAAVGFARQGIKLPKKYKISVWIGLFLFGSAIAFRLYQSRNLLLPNWVDSQHHYLIIKVIIERGGLPETLAPYLSLPFYYHYGFHAVTALFSGISGLEIGQSILVFGQILNAAIGLSIYALGVTLWDDWRPAAAGAILVSFATRMPAYYLSWGRYTLMTGLVLLPLAMSFALQLAGRSRRKRDIAALALLTAGVLLSHYFAAILLALFLVLITIVMMVPRFGDFWRAVKDFYWVPVGAVLGFLLAAPWLWRVAQFSPGSAGVGVNLPESVEAVVEGSGRWDYIWQLLGPASNHWLLLAAGLGVLIGMIRLKRVGFGIWSLLLGGLTLPWTFTLRPFRPDHFAIVLFFPAALWAGYLFWQAGRWVGDRLNQGWLSLVLILSLVGGWIAWGLPLSTDIVNPVTVLVTGDDVDALAWVAENTPEEARFYINTAHWQSGMYRGVDGGGWTLPYAGRWSLVPTVFYGFSPDGDTVRQIRDWGERASTITTCSTEFWEIVDEADLGWVYIREGAGSLQPEGLVGCEGVRVVYNMGSIKIYTLER